MKTEWDIDSNALLLVAEPAMASQEELLYSIQQIEKIIGTGYYDGLGDKLLGDIIEYLKKLYKINMEAWQNMEIASVLKTDGE